MPRARLAGPIALALVLMTAACTHAVAPKTWAADVCRALAPWRAQISSLNADAQHAIVAARTAAETRADLLALLGGARDATDRALARVKDAGVPDVDGGAVIERRFVASLTKISAAYDHAATTIGALDTAAADAFYKGVGAAMTTLNSEYAQSGIDTNQLVSTELEADFDTVSACR